MRRFIFLAIIFFMNKLEMIDKVIFFVVVQILYLSYIVGLRPQGSSKENLIDVINEVFYTYFVMFLLYYNSEGRWSETITEAYFWIMMSNNFVLMLVTFRKRPLIIFSIFDKICHYVNSKSMKKISGETTK